MDNRNPRLEWFIEHESSLQRLLAEARMKKISIYADMLFNMDTHDFIDFVTGAMAWSFGTLATMIAATPPDSHLFKDFCMDPAAIAHDAMAFASVAVLFGSLHALYRYSGYQGYLLNNVNFSINHYTNEKANYARRREALFPESKSYFSSAIESARNLFGI